MHVLFVHRNYPAQFGHIAANLVARHGFRCTFVSERPPGFDQGVERIQYKVQGGATSRTHYCSRSFENAVWHAHGAYQALEARPDVRPDLVVGHSGFGSTVFLKELYDAPVVNYFEFFYHTKDSDLDFRPDFPGSKLDALRARARNGMILLDLDNCDAAYSPTRYQRDLFPPVYRSKIDVIFDGIDTSLWRPDSRQARLRMIAGRSIPDGMKIVTYAARGFESMRGFDVFMKAARILCERRRDVLFVVVGEDRVCYGADQRVTGEKTFKEWVLGRDDYDLDRFVFTGLLSPADLARVFRMGDLHVYLTVPFVLSWSLMNALACGVTLLGSDTPPVREMVAHGVNGLLTDFFDPEALADAASRVLDDPAAHRPLGEAAVAMIGRDYSLDVCLPRLVDLFRATAARASRPTGYTHDEVSTPIRDPLDECPPLS